MAGIALFGIGRIGRTHLQGILANHRCHLRYVVDSKTELAERVLEEHGVTDVAVVDDSRYHTTLRDPAVDGVVIATPTDTHEVYIHDALEASKAVFSEKPLAADVPAIARCYDLARKMDRPLFCGFQRRFDPYFSSIYQRVQAGELGKIYHIQTNSRDGELAPPEYFEGAPGIFHDSAVHDIDIMCWLAGEEPEGVFAHGAVHHPGIAKAGDLDVVSVLLQFPNKVQGTIHVCRHSTFGYDQRLEVGDISTFVCYALTIPWCEVCSNGLLSTTLSCFSNQW